MEKPNTMNDTIRHDRDGGFTVIPEREMELKRAVKILKDHNEWRRDEYPKPRASPKDVGAAIDVIVDHLTDNK